MSSILAQKANRHWWLLLLRGILAVVLGLIAFFDPGITLLTLIYIFAFYAIFDGVTAITFAFRERAHNSWGWLLIEGLVSIIAGILAFTYPGETAIVFLYIIAAWALITGLMELVAAFVVHSTISWGLALGGLISIVLAIVLFRSPISGILSILWVIGIYGVVFGIGIIIDAFRLRSFVTKERA
jgi:uncharacterized membrane protein HdeD (DUF308 family)